MNNYNVEDAVKHYIEKIVKKIFEEGISENLLMLKMLLNNVQLNCILNLPHAIFSEQGHWKIENTVTLYGGGRIREHFVEPDDNEDFLRVLTLGILDGVMILYMTVGQYLKKHI